ncbi:MULTISPECIES: 3-hydroxyacyl-ACP dehydratase FabZ family protein [Massilia]|uniref:Beta-hydroxyacyl-ACP dehydratase n=3 Tax=Massilia TaxID=149698 RepID=A0ABX0LN26_9BURK|nr:MULTISPECIES: 3-hydroxyacyl-ACP dehydratase FabZ family protein [Massilia]NHZ34083.1 beta-hydroxyacyl-ACP dehydratase [Massilia rubra]NHZ65525.1 3-hydroxyacyl-[acyl-carrier-protein] dehydratase FabZ [Massilia genomosp. 1]NHZ87770.1 3-hydroxyacyl-[acyl-carrier-protein] dehydratase FabZ [Massilia mucilaginosa]
MRYILLDKITALVPPQLASGVKCVSLSDDIFADHFPGHPIMPGAMIIESMAQLGGVLVEASMREQGRHDLHALLVTVDRAKFRHQVRAGDKMELECHGIVVHEDGGQVRAMARVDGKLVAEAELAFAFARVTNPKLLARRREVLNIWLTGSAEEP